MSLSTSLNSICPYYTMFPLEFPLGVLKKAKQGQTIADPFCGRGTTLFAARIKKMRAVGIDSSPVAVAISKAKLSRVSQEEVVELCKTVINQQNIEFELPSGEFWSLAYHEKTLMDLCKLRSYLIERNGRTESAADNVLRGLLLGALHGPLNKSDVPSSFFSNQMMRTFAPKPDYAVKFWKSRKLSPPYSDIAAVIEKRAARFLSEQPISSYKVKVEQGDSRSKKSYSSVRAKIDWVVTSPPYYGMNTYEQDQWIRKWFLGGEHKPNYKTKVQLSHSSIETFSADLAKVWDNVYRHANNQLRMIVRFGSIGSRLVDYTDIIRKSLELSEADWKIMTSKAAGDSSSGRRQSLSMGPRGHSSAVQERDFYIKLR